MYRFYPLVVAVLLFVIPLGVKHLRSEKDVQGWHKPRTVEIPQDIVQRYQEGQARLAGDVVIAAVRSSRIEETIDIAGHVEAASTASVYAIQDGVVSKVLVRRGDHVKLNQPLMELESPSLDNQIGQLEEDLLETQSARQAVDAALEAADALVKEKQAKVWECRRYLSRTNRLIRYGALPASWETDDLAALEAAHAGLRRAEEDRETALAKVEAHKGFVHAVYRRINRATDARAQLTVLAPVDGIVTELLADVGTHVGPTRNRKNPLARIEQPESMRVVMLVPSKAARLIDFDHDTLDCVVQGAASHTLLQKATRYFSVVADAAPHIRVEMDVANPVDDFTGQRMFAAGDLSSLTLPLSIHEDIATLPANAIRHEGGTSFVVVVDDKNVCRQVPVTIEVAQRDVVGVGSGVQHGDLVIVEPADKHRSGDRVARQTLKYHEAFRPTRMGSLDR